MCRIPISSPRTPREWVDKFKREISWDRRVYGQEERQPKGARGVVKSLVVRRLFTMPLSTRRQMPLPEKAKQEP